MGTKALIQGQKFDTPAVRSHPYKYEKDFNAVVAFLTQYIDKRVPTPCVKIASVTQTTPAK